MIVMREQLNVKQRQAISETPAKGGGGLVELLLVTWPDRRLSGQATLARLLPSGLSTHRVQPKVIPIVGLISGGLYLLRAETLRTWNSMRFRDGGTPTTPMTR